MLRFTYIFIMLFVSNSLIAQEKRPLPEFEELVVADRLSITLVPSDTENYLVVDGELVDNFEVVQKNNSVRLKMAPGYILRGEGIQIKLYYTKLSHIVVRTGAHVTNDGSELVTDSLYVAANEGSKVKLTIHTNKLKTFVSTGGVVSLKGEAKDQIVNVAFGGAFNSKELVSKSTVASTNAGGKCEITATDMVDLQIRAGGVIDVYGSPKDRRTKRLAGGKINFIED